MGEIDELDTERDQAPTASIVALYGTIIYLFLFARVLRTIIVQSTGHLSLVFFATLRYSMHSHFISCMPFEYRHAQIATTFSYLPPHLVSISTHINGCLLYPSVVNACCFREGFDKLLKLGLSITIEQKQYMLEEVLKEFWKWQESKF